jgi:hypothetical protein
MGEALGVQASQTQPDHVLLGSNVFEALRWRVVNKWFLELSCSNLAMTFASNESIVTAVASHKCLCYNLAHFLCISAERRRHAHSRRRLPSDL